jgi:hypothetical protein
MTLKEAKALEWSGTIVEVDKGARRARLWCADAKWTADMKGMATVQYVDKDGNVPSWAPRNGNALVARRRLRVAA